MLGGSAMKAFFWPTNYHDDTKIAVRLGRVLHWMITAIAIVLLIGASVLLILNYEAVVSSQRQHANWLAANPDPKTVKDGRVQFTIPLKDGHHAIIEGPAAGTRNEAITQITAQGFHVDDTPDPSVQAFDYSASVGFFICAALLFLVGRAIRYIVAGE